MLAPPIQIYSADAIEEQVSIVPEHSWPVRAWRGCGAGWQWIFGLVSVLFGLAFLAAIPVVQFASLGYLLECSGRIVRERRLRAGFVGFDKAARVGGIVLGTWLLLWPLRFLSDLWYSAQLIEPGGRSATVLRVILLVLTTLFVSNVILAWCCGGKLRHFFWPLLAPLFFAMWIVRRLVASDMLRPILRPVVGSVSPRLLADLTTVPALHEWFPPAIFLADIRQGRVLARAQDAVWEFVVRLRLPYYFWLGARGFVGAVIWLLLPAVMMIGMTKVPALLTEAGARSGALRLFSVFAGLSGFFGTVLMAFVILYLPFLQTQFAAENRFAAMFELRRIRHTFRRAPIAFWFALLITLLFSLPLYLLKIEYTLRELLWIPSLVFVVFIYPARLLSGWALSRAERRVGPRHFFFRWVARFAELPVVGFYVFVLFFTQYVSWDGAWSLLEQPPFLLPAPFFGM